jgi:hypothetical protein
VEPSPPAEFADEADAIAYLLSLERINETLLQSGLNSPAMDFDDETRTMLETMRGNDELHVESLRALMLDRESELAEPELPALAVPERAGLYLQRFSRLKELAVAAYADVLERMPSLAGGDGVGSIISVEGRHAAYLAIQVANPPFSSATEQAMSRPEVLAEVEALWRG